MLTLLLSAPEPDRLRVEQSRVFAGLILVAVLALTVMGAHWLPRGAKEVLPVWVHPPVLMGAFFLGLYGISGYATFFFPDLASNIEVMVGLHYGYTAWGLALVLVGFVALWAGYLVGLRVIRPLPFLRVPQIGEMPQRILWLVYLLTVALRLFEIAVVGAGFFREASQLGEFQGFSQWLGYVQSVALLVLAIVAIRVSRQNLPLLIVVVITEFAFVFISGFGGQSIPLMIIILTALRCSGISLRPLVPLALIIGMIVVIAYPVTHGLREQEFDPRSVGSVVNAVDESVRSTWGEGAGTALEIVWAKLTGRQAEAIYAPGVIMRKTPSEIPYQGFGRFFMIPAYVVPRVIWEDKPILSNYVWFSINYYNHPPTSISSTPMTIFGDTYMYAGWVGTIFGLGMLGLFFALVFRNTAGTGLLPVYLVLTRKFLYFEGNYPTLIVEIFQQLLILLIVLWFMAYISRVRSSRLRSKPR